MYFINFLFVRYELLVLIFTKFYISSLSNTLRSFSKNNSLFMFLLEIKKSQRNYYCPLTVKIAFT